MNFRVFKSPVEFLRPFQSPFKGPPRVFQAPLGAPQSRFSGLENCKEESAPPSVDVSLAAEHGASAVCRGV